MNSLVLASVICALTLLVSGVAKLRDPLSNADAFVALRIPKPLAHPAMVRALPIIEVLLGVGLLLTWGRLQVVMALLTLGLMLAYVVVIARALRFDDPVSCSCFGSLAGSPPISNRTLLRNVLLVVAAALAVVGSLNGVSLVRSFSSVWAWVLLAALGAAVAVMIADRGADPAHEAASAPATSPAVADDEEAEADYIRLPVPYGELLDADNNPVTLHQLISESAVLLVNVSIGCGPCHRVAPQVPGWAEQLAPLRVVVTVRDRPIAVDAFPQVADYFMQDTDSRVANMMRLANPSAVLLGADGLLAGGPVIGVEAVEEFVAEIAAALAENPVPDGEQSSELGDADADAVSGEVI